MLRGEWDHLDSQPGHLGRGLGQVSSDMEALFLESVGQGDGAKLSLQTLQLHAGRPHQGIGSRWAVDQGQRGSCRVPCRPKLPSLWQCCRHHLSQAV